MSSVLKRFDAETETWEAIGDAQHARVTALLLLTDTPIAEVTRALGDSQAGLRFLIGLGQRYDLVLGVDFTDASPNQIGPAFQNLELHRLDILAVGPREPGEVLEKIAAVHGTMVHIQKGPLIAPEIANAGPWERTYSISTTEDVRPLRGNHLELPITAEMEFHDVETLLKLDCVGHTLARWLLHAQRAEVLGEGSDPWRDRDFAVIAHSWSADYGLARAREGVRWVVVRFPPKADGMPRSVVVEADRLVALLGAGSRSLSVAEVLDSETVEERSLHDVGPFLGHDDIADAVACIDQTGQVRAVSTKLTSKELELRRSEERRYLSARDGARGGAPAVSQTVSADAPDTIWGDEDAGLEVTVAGRPTPRGIGVVQEELEVSEDMNLQVSVTTTGPLEVTGPAMRTAAIQSKTDSVNLKFGLRGIGVGTGQIRVMVSQGAFHVRTLPPLSIRISPNRPATQQTLECRLEELSPWPSGNASLIIGPTDGANGVLQFTLQDDRGVTVAETASECGLNDVERLGADLQARYPDALTSPVGLETFVRACSKLFHDVFPAEVRELLGNGNWQSGPIHLLSTDRRNIPWELACLSSEGPAAEAEFLGQLGLTRSMQSARPGPSSNMNMRLAYSLCPTGGIRGRREVRQAKSEQKYLTNTYRFHPIPKPAGRRVFDLVAGGRFDIIHLAGRSQTGAFDQYIRLDEEIVEESLSLQQLSGIRWDTAPLVFLNSCSGTRQFHGWTDLGAFARGFAEAGAGAFVGSLCEVDDGQAFAVSKTFYDQFLGQQRTLSETARHLRSEGPTNQRISAMWYPIFGHPNLKVNDPAYL